jgi:hypothetical protein
MFCSPAAASFPLEISGQEETAKVSSILIISRDDIPVYLIRTSNSMGFVRLLGLHLLSKFFPLLSNYYERPSTI